MSEPEFDGLDDFAGPGGWDEGAKMLGLRLLGVEWDDAACATAEAAGHARVKADVTRHQCDGEGVGKLYIGSPSCTLFSAAGTGVGRLVMDVLADGIRRIFRGDDPDVVRVETEAAIYPVTLAEAQAKNKKRKPEKRWATEKVEAKARTDAFVAALVLQPARRIVQMDPERVALEQVREVRPLWQVYVYELRRRGWSAWEGILCAADFGVPQERYRAILMASRVSIAQPPVPTHGKHPDDGALFGEPRKKWVSMADALAWGWEDEPACTVSSGGAASGGAEPFANADYRERLRAYVVDRWTNSKGPRGTTVPTVARPLSEPAPTLTGKSGEQWVIREGERPPVYVNGNQPNAGRRSIDEPAPTVLFGQRHNDTRWVYERPATTVVGSFKPDVIAAPGYRTDISRQDAPGSVSVSVSISEAGVLQSFRANYPWQGSRTKQYEQVGNAVPPLMAAHILAALLGLRDRLIEHLEAAA